MSTAKLTQAKSRRKTKEKIRRHLGGSDMGALLGVHPKRDPLDVYNSILEIVPREPENPHMRRGKALESIAADEYELKTGNKVIREPVELVHKDYDFLRSNIDRKIIRERKVRVEKPRPLEIKCPSLGAFTRYRQYGLPLYLVAQLQWYMGMMGVDSGDWAIFCADLWQTINFPVEADPDTYNVMVEVGVRFWTEHIEKRIPPPKGKPDKELAKFEAIPGELILVDTPEYSTAMGLLYEVRQLEEDQKALKLIAREQFKEAVGGEYGKYSGPGGKMYWVQRAGRKTIDKEALIAAAPIDRTKLEAAIKREFGKGPYQKIIKLLSEAGLDLEEFYKVGEPFDDFHPYFRNED